MRALAPTLLRKRERKTERERKEEREGDKQREREVREIKKCGERERERVSLNEKTKKGKNEENWKSRQSSTKAKLLYFFKPQLTFVNFSTRFRE